MAIGYHKLNSSAARSKPVMSASSTTLEHDVNKLMDIKKGDVVSHCKFGRGVVVNGCMLGGMLTVAFSGGDKVLISDYVITSNEV